MTIHNYLWKQSSHINFLTVLLEIKKVAYFSEKLASHPLFSQFLFENKYFFNKINSYTFIFSIQNFMTR